MESRNATFQRLKPPCVHLNQTIVTFQNRPNNADQVIACLEQLRQSLESIQPTQLDSKLAEYVFIPLSYVLKSSQRLPIQASETTFACIAILLRDGWRERIAGPLGAQLLILLAITADRSQKSVSTREPSDDLLNTVFVCLGHLFQGLQATQAGRAQLLETTTIPHLGHCVTVILDGLGPVNSQKTQISATDALASLIQAIQDHEVLSSFLPGMVSALTKVLTPSTQARRSWRVLVRCLDALRVLFSDTVSDRVTEDIRSNTGEKKTNTPKPTRTLNTAWLQATGGQLKLALANINRLHSNDRLEVQTALFELNLSILRDCSDSLQNCRQMCLEILMVLSDNDQLDTCKAELLQLLQLRSTLTDSLQTTLRDWTLSLPRVIEGSDEDKKGRRLRHAFTAYNALQESDSDSRSVQALFADGLPEYVNGILGLSSKDQSPISEAPAVRLEDLPMTLQGRGSTTFPDALSSSRHQTHLLSLIQQQLQHLANTDRLAPLAESFTTLVRTSTGPTQISAFHLGLTSLRTTSESDALFNLDPTPWRSDLLTDLYDFSLTLLTSPTSNPAPLILLSLETLALQATALGPDFRPELLDTLYPVLTLLASPSPRLRTHAITTLNILTTSCAYPDVKALVTENADYLVNAIALKLNAFEVDPEAPQVLSMAVKLAGSGIVPYLGDTVDVIFGILEDYHGYERLVELLFGALRAVTEVGVREPRLALEGRKEEQSGVEQEREVLNIASLVGILRERKAKVARAAADAVEGRERAPERPWGDAGSKAKDENEREDEEDEEQKLSEAEKDKDPLPAPQTYPLLLRIAELTQHFLSSSSPTLRGSLLGLLNDVMPGLARHENSFLPLINTLWPEIVSRLKDDEEYIVAGALEVIGMMSREAKGFMRTRIVDVWPDLKRIYKRLERSVDGGRKQASRSGGGGGGRTVRRIEDATQSVFEVDKTVALAKRMEVGYVDPGTKGLWTALRRLLITVVRDVKINEEMFGDVLGMLRPLDHLDDEERKVLEEINRGAVWLAQYREDHALLKIPARIINTRDRWAWAGVTA